MLTGLAYGASPDENPVSPSVADVAYGTDPNQKLDLYLPQGPGPFPILFWIHGGGWYAGDKRGDVKPALYLQAGCAVVSVNYRLVGDAVAQHISPPIGAVLSDNRRALQFVRLHGADWHLNPDKIVVGGVSAGAASALYLGCEGEQANPNSADPVERVSTKVLGIAAVAAQTSVDPQRILEWVPGVAWGYLGFEPGEIKPQHMPDFQQFLTDRDKWLPDITKYSPDILLTKDAPPIYFLYNQGLPTAGPTPPIAQLVHSPLWGIGFQRLAQEHGVECYLQYPGHPAEKYGSIVNFVLHQLGLGEKGPSGP